MIIDRYDIRYHIMFLRYASWLVLHVAR